MMATEQAKQWMPEDAALARLAAELDETFAVEQALFSARLNSRVLHALPREVGTMVRLARALTGAVLVAAAGCAGLLFLLVRPYGVDLPPQLLAKAVLGGGALVVGVLLTFAARPLASLDCRMLSRLTGRLVRPRAIDLVVVRLGALFLLVASGLVMAL